MNPRNEEQLARMSPEKRAKAMEVIARHNTPEAKERHYRNIEAVEREIRETATISPVPLEALGASLRERRKAAGKSLEALSAESGMDQGFLSRIERGAVPNPTVGTLARVAAALGGRITLGFEAVERAE